VTDAARNPWGTVVAGTVVAGIVVAGTVVVGDVAGGVVVRGVVEDVLGDVVGGTVFFVVPPPQAAVMRATTTAAAAAQRLPFTSGRPHRREHGRLAANFRVAPSFGSPGSARAKPAHCQHIGTCWIHARHTEKVDTDDLFLVFSPHGGYCIIRITLTRH
jgi:hypothetical protein